MTSKEVRKIGGSQIADTSASDSQPSAVVAPDGATAEARRTRKETIIVWTSRCAILLAFIGIWDAAVRRGWADPFFVGDPREVMGYLWRGTVDGLIWFHVQVTLVEAVVGLVIGATAGIATGLLLARFPIGERIVDPFLLGLNALPRIALAPIFILWFGLGPVSKIAVSVSLVYFILVINTRSGVRSVDDDVLVTSRLLGTTPRQQFLKVILPACVPPIFAGLRLGVQYSLLGAVGAELIGAEKGMGQQIAYFAGTFQVSGVFAMLVVLAAVSILMAMFMARIERHLLRWQRT